MDAIFGGWFAATGATNSVVLISHFMIFTLEKEKRMYILAFTYHFNVENL